MPSGHLLKKMNMKFDFYFLFGYGVQDTAWGLSKIGSVIGDFNHITEMPAIMPLKQGQTRKKPFPSTTSREFHGKLPIWKYSAKVGQEAVLPECNHKFSYKFVPKIHTT